MAEDYKDYIKRNRNQASAWHMFLVRTARLKDTYGAWARIVLNDACKATPQFARAYIDHKYADDLERRANLLRHIDALEDLFLASKVEPQRDCSQWRELGDGCFQRRVFA